MTRREVLTLICDYRRSRDRCDRTSTFERGMRAGYHLAAIWLWRNWRSTCA